MALVRNYIGAYALAMFGKGSTEVKLSLLQAAIPIACCLTCMDCAKLVTKPINFLVLLAKTAHEFS